MKSIISELKAKQDPRSNLMLDILRALVVFGGSLWLSELPDALSRLHLGEAQQADTRVLLDAAKKLEGFSVIRIEKRPRASERAGGVEDFLLTLTNEEVRLSLLSDEVLNKYYLDVSRLLEEKN